jgi:hypothetical protein
MGDKGRLILLQVRGSIAFIVLALSLSLSARPAQAQDTAALKMVFSPSNLTTSAGNVGVVQPQFSAGASYQHFENLQESVWPTNSFTFLSAHLADVPRRTVSPSTDPLGAWLIPSEDDQRSAGNHLEGGIVPRVVFAKNSQYPVSVSIPISMALGDQEYWIGHQFGYVSGGVDVRIPLFFLPARYGKWTVGTNADICYYGTTTAEFMRSVPELGAIKITAVLRTDL